MLERGIRQPALTTIFLLCEAWSVFNARQHVMVTEEVPVKKSRFTDSQIIAILKQAEAGCAAPDLCREHGFSSAALYKWRWKFDGMDTSIGLLPIPKTPS